MRRLFIPIHFIYYGKKSWALALVIFLATFYILYIVKPNVVDYAEHRVSYLFTCVLQSLNPTLLFILFPLLVPAKFKTASEWNIGREFLYLLILILGVGVGNYLLRGITYIHEDSWAIKFLIEEIINGFIVGLAVSTIVVLLRIALELRLNLQKADRLLINLKKAPTASQTVATKLLTIKGSLKSETFNLKIPELLYAQSAGNYVDVFLQKNGKIQKITTRLTLSSFAQQLADYPNVMRVHKSYVVNLDKIETVRGNAAGLFLQITSLSDTTVPVSRKYVKAFEQIVQKRHAVAN
ncbi:MAG: LytR/AlgR family response regulator transcription factor [Saprospiraceae bacterium]